MCVCVCNVDPCITSVSMRLQVEYMTLFMLAAHTKTLFWLGCTNKQSVQILLESVTCSLMISDPKHKNVFDIYSPHTLGRR